MCGRYTIKHPEQIAPEFLERYGITGFSKVSRQDVLTSPRFNVAPTQELPLAVPSGDRFELCSMRWGFVPFYARDNPKAPPLINARAESVAEKPTFRQPLQKRRALAPADGFYEWKKVGATKVPHHIQLRSGLPFMFAAIYEEGVGGGFALLTTAPNELMAPIHDRMPVILAPDAAREWLKPGPIDPARVAELCVAYPAAEMVAHPVSAYVSNARNQGPQCVAPVSGSGQAELV